MKDLHIKILIPVGVQSLLDDTGSMRLLCIDSDDCKRVRESKHIALGQAIGSNDYDEVSKPSARWFMFNFLEQNS